MMIVNETNCKWNVRTIDNLRNKVVRVGKDVNVSASDSKEYELTKNDYFPGGTLATTFGKLSSYVIE